VVHYKTSLQNDSKIPGHQTALSDAEEKAMVQHLMTLADWGFPDAQE